MCVTTTWYHRRRRREASENATEAESVAVVKRSTVLPWIPMERYERLSSEETVTRRMASRSASDSM